MDPAEQETPLKKLHLAVRSAGGTKVVAQIAGIPASHLGNILCGRRELARPTAIRLRPHIDLDADTWLELLAPAPDQQPEASEATP